MDSSEKHSENEYAADRSSFDASNDISADKTPIHPPRLTIIRRAATRTRSETQSTTGSISSDEGKVALKSTAGKPVELRSEGLLVPGHPRAATSLRSTRSGSANSNLGSDRDTSPAPAVRRRSSRLHPAEPNSNSRLVLLWLHLCGSLYIRICLDCAATTINKLLSPLLSQFRCFHMYDESLVLMCPVCSNRERISSLVVVEKGKAQNVRSNFSRPSNSYPHAALPPQWYQYRAYVDTCSAISNLSCW